MRTQSPDTSPETERYLIELIRQASPAKRFRLVQSLSQRMLSGRFPDQDARTQAIHSITCGYGKRTGQRVQRALVGRPDWQEQSVDLSAILFPVMQALHKVGISSYIGGSIASSIHGMQQSASDIDLVLIQQEPTAHAVVVSMPVRSRADLELAAQRKRTLEKMLC